MLETRSRQDVAMAPKEVATGLQKKTSSFLFWLLAQCSDMPFASFAGNFVVAEHLKAEASNAHKAVNQILFGLVLMIMGQGLLP